MHVAIDALQVGASPAGVGRYVIGLVHALDQVAGEDVAISVAVSEAARRWFNTGGRVRVEVVSPAEGSPRRILRQQLLLPRRQRGCDLVHYPDYLVPACARPAPAVVTIHDLSYVHDAGYFTAGQQLLRRVMGPIGVRAARGISADSAFTRDEIVRRYPALDPARIRVIYPGVRAIEDPGPHGRREVRARFALPDKFVLSVGTLEPRKNLVSVLQAFGTCAELSSVHLVLAGARGWGGDAVRQAVERHPSLAGRLTVTGYLEDDQLAGLYHEAAAFVYLSRYEGFGFPILEAMGCGLPVVASDIPVLKEVGGAGARFVGATDIPAIGAAVGALLNDPDAAGRLAALGRENVARFSWKRCAEETLALYRAARSGS